MSVFVLCLRNLRRFSPGQIGGSVFVGAVEYVCARLFVAYARHFIISYSSE